jgi:hypothetical protein
MWGVKFTAVARSNYGITSIQFLRVFSKMAGAALWTSFCQADFTGLRHI